MANNPHQEDNELLFSLLNLRRSKISGNHQSYNLTVSFFEQIFDIFKFKKKKGVVVDHEWSSSCKNSRNMNTHWPFVLTSCKTLLANYIIR